MGDNFYAAWRRQHGPADFLREIQIPPPERLLQAIWHHQRILRDQLKTLDGKAVRVLHPGFWNREAGPDFRNAVIQIGGETKTGDIEIDLACSGWRGHGHHRNPNFKNVILHIIWENEPHPDEHPLLSLQPYLDAPLEEIAEWLGTETAQGWPTELRGKCCAPLHSLSSEKLEELLRQAARVRLERKAREFEARARQAGWEQAFWEGIFRALGYKQNVWPMRRIAELVPKATPSNPNATAWQAQLLGLSGLLDHEVPEKAGSSKYVRELWDIWWRERERFTDSILPRTLWKFNGLRPANHPQRRLALAAYWLARDKFFSDLEQWFTNEEKSSRSPELLFELLQVPSDPFWSRHFTLRSVRMAVSQPLIGEKRITDLAINTILPWFWIRAVAGKNLKLQKLAEDRYFSWPAAEDNAVLRLARQRLLGQHKSNLFHTAAAQQGLLQVVRDFCEYSNAVCTDCRFPDLVRQWSAC